MCCTVTGENRCPPGSFAAGWWKADNSGLCCGNAARYYIDCNMQCGGQCQCRCASGTCDERKVCCNVFRYGQCHQEIACYGPIVCRVVSCNPPWTFDETCSRDVLVDNATAQHSAPCLPPGCPPPTNLAPAPTAPQDPLSAVVNVISRLLQSLGRGLSSGGR